jgi:hypothetical protein
MFAGVGTIRRVKVVVDIVAPVVAPVLAAVLATAVAPVVSPVVLPVAVAEFTAVGRQRRLDDVTGASGRTRKCASMESPPCRRRTM